MKTKIEIDSVNGILQITTDYNIVIESHAAALALNKQKKETTPIKKHVAEIAPVANKIASNANKTANTVIKRQARGIARDPKKCKLCGTEFIPKNNHQEYCSRKCVSKLARIAKENTEKKK